MAYKDRDKQRTAQRDWVRQKRAKDKGSTATTDKEILVSWARGEGTEYQRRMGVLAGRYPVQGSTGQGQTPHPPFEGSEDDNNTPHTDFTKK